MDYSSLSCLTVCEIVGALPHGTFSHSEQRSRPKLEAAVLSLPSQYRQILSDLAFTKQHCKTSLLEDNNPSLYRALRILTMKEIVDALPPETFTLRERRSAAKFNQARFLSTKSTSSKQVAKRYGNRCRGRIRRYSGVLISSTIDAAN